MKSTLLLELDDCIYEVLLSDQNILSVRKTFESGMCKDMPFDSLPKKHQSQILNSINDHDS